MGLDLGASKLEVDHEHSGEIDLLIAAGEFDDYITRIIDDRERQKEKT